MPEGIARLLRVLQWLVGYGKTFAETLHQRTATEFRIFADRYRRTDFNEILARIRRGVMLVAALEEKLLDRAATGRDVVPVEYRHSTPRPDRAGTTGKHTRVRHTNIVDMPPDRLPTAEQIAAELRRRPLGAVLADICRDLGIRPGDLTREQWKELHDLILAVRRMASPAAAAARSRAGQDDARRSQRRHEMPLFCLPHRPAQSGSGRVTQGCER